MPTQDPSFELESAVERVGRIVTEFYQQLELRRVEPGADLAELDRLFAGTIGDDGIGLDAVLEEFERLVLPNSMTTPHPLYLGLINSSPLPAGPLADLLVSTLNNNGGARHQNPAMSAAEREVIRAFAELLGFSDDIVGMTLPGGTLANLHGLLLARTATFPEWRDAGAAAAAERTPRLYASETTHFSVSRAAHVIGIGESNVVPIRTSGRGALDPSALRAAIAADRSAGRQPVAVVATIGSTGTGAIDPVSHIAEVCDEAGVWLHVDACYGGAAALVDELRPSLAGIERADSLAVDPHKWFFIPIAAALALTPHADIEHKTFSTPASYVPYRDDDDTFLRGIPTSRRSSGLTIWMALRAHGWSSVRDAVRRNVDQARLLEQQLADQGFDVLPGGELSMVNARYQPSGWSLEDGDALQEDIARRAVASGRFWFATVRHDGRTWLRLNIVNLHTRDRHMVEVAEWLGSAAQELAEPRQS